MDVAPISDIISLPLIQKEMVKFPLLLAVISASDPDMYKLDLGEISSDAKAVILRSNKQIRIIGNKRAILFIVEYPFYSNIDSITLCISSEEIFPFILHSNGPLVQIAHSLPAFCIV